MLVLPQYLDPATKKAIATATEAIQGLSNGAIASNLLMSLFFRGLIQQLWGMIKGLQYPTSLFLKQI
jgi:hypothetical protein